MLVHIISESDWSRTRDAGDPYIAAGQDEIGFMHLSTPEQVLIPANLFYRGRNDLVLLIIDESTLGPELRWEEGVPPSGDMLFPHLYGPLDISSVTGVVPFLCCDDGSFELPQGLTDSNGTGSDGTSARESPR